ncbi:MAG: proton-conducting transporter membrane subunit, partial [Candidatus Paceibacterales bacterium]
PVLCAFFLIGILATIGLPGFANFWGELTIFLSLWQMNPWYVAAAVLGVVISAIYGLRAVASIFFGPPSEALREHVWGKKSIEDLSWKERMAPILLVVFLLIIGFWPKSMMHTINRALSGVDSPLVAKK